jgi:hypothetical protein
MNLWAKSLKQLPVLAVALFFFSCEDDTSIIGYKNPNKKFNVQFVDIPLESSVILMDSTITDIADGSGFVLAGEYFDPVFGNIHAQPFLQISTNTATKVVADAIYDSASIQFRLNFYAYGFSGTDSLSFSVRELTDTLSYSGKNRYYTTSSVNYSAEEIARVSVLVDSDDLDTLSLTGGRDTLLLAGALDETYAKNLLTIAKTNPDSILHYFDRFKKVVKGLTLVPEEPNGVLGLNVSSSLSKIVIYYHIVDTNGNEKKLERTFGFNQSFLVNTSFTQILNDRTGTELATAVPYEAMDLSARYLQSGNRVMTKLDLTNFYNFADTVENIMINSAEIVIENPDASPGTLPHSAALLRIMNDENRFVKSGDPADSLELLKYYVAADGNYSNHQYHVLADRPDAQYSPAVVGYDRDDNRFSGFITLFAQSMFRNKKVGDAINENRIKLLGLYGLSPEMNRSVSRTVFGKDNIKLRIYYTRPTNLTP